MTTIRDLKNALGTGLGSRKNKYLIELSFGNLDSNKFNILCKSASLPQRTIDTTTVSYHGRAYTIRAETNYQGTYEVTIIDDDKLTFRRFFDTWMKLIDDSKTIKTQLQSDSIGNRGGGNAFQKYMGMVNDFSEAVQENLEDLRNIDNIAKDAFSNLFASKLNTTYTKSIATYQTDFNIWQLDGNGNKVYGYTIQNAFPSDMGAITYDDGENDTLVEYPVTFTFSEFTPFDNKKEVGDVVNDILGL